MLSKAELIIRYVRGIVVVVGLPVAGVVLILEGAMFYLILGIAVLLLWPMLLVELFAARAEHIISYVRGVVVVAGLPVIGVILVQERTPFLVLFGVVTLLFWAWTLVELFLAWRKRARRS